MPAAQRQGDALAQVPDGLVARKGHSGLRLEPAAALGPDVVIAVDHDLAHRRVVDQRLDGPKPGDIVHQSAQQLRPRLRRVDLLEFDDLLNLFAHRRQQVRVVRLEEQVGIDAAQEPVAHPGF